MPAWDDYKKQARERGALAKELYMVRSTPIGDIDLLQATLPDHLAYQANLEKMGHLVLAGPISSESGDQMLGEGMMIYRAVDIDEARQIAEDDPMHKMKARRYELRKWLINEGSISIQVGLSTGQRDFL